jgi:hypothetical protein
VIERLTGTAGSLGGAAGLISASDCAPCDAGWLCPALLLYFEQAPRRIFIRCDPLPAGVNPIWTPKRGDTVRRFVEAP